MSHTHTETEEIKCKSLRCFNSPLTKGIYSNYESANFQQYLVFLFYMFTFILHNYMYLLLSLFEFVAK